MPWHGMAWHVQQQIATTYWFGFQPSNLCQRYLSSLDNALYFRYMTNNCSFNMFSIADHTNAFAQAEFVINSYLFLQLVDQISQIPCRKQTIWYQLPDVRQTALGHWSEMVIWYALFNVVVVSLAQIIGNSQQIAFMLLM
jgi:hypothetical protein